MARLEVCCVSGGRVRLSTASEVYSGRGTGAAATTATRSGSDGERGLLEAGAEAVEPLHFFLWRSGVLSLRQLETWDALVS